VDACLLFNWCDPPLYGPEVVLGKRETIQHQSYLEKASESFRTVGRKKTQNVSAFYYFYYTTFNQIKEHKPKNNFRIKILSLFNFLQLSCSQFFSLLIQIVKKVYIAQYPCSPRIFIGTVKNN
jgi:hypothetical protein